LEKKLRFNRLSHDTTHIFLFTIIVEKKYFYYSTHIYGIIIIKLEFEYNIYLPQVVYYITLYYFIIFYEKNHYNTYTAFNM